MSRGTVDLFLGSGPGLWVLAEVTARDVHCIVTQEPGVTETARRRGFTVLTTDPHAPDFSPGEMCLSVHYPRILGTALLTRYRRCYNLHPGYLPWGRGYFPVFWSLWQGTPAGATLHEMISRVDHGPIVEQERVGYTDADTGGSLHTRVVEAERRLLRKYWRRIAAGEELPVSPQEGQGSYHSRKEFTDLKTGTAWRTLPDEDLRRLVRCLTLPGYSNLQVTIDGRRYELGLDVTGAVAYHEMK
jgi:methionyl-tRNA formyltransferase